MFCLSLKASSYAAISKGYPWIFSQDISSKNPKAAPGELVYIANPKGRPFAIGYYNPHTKLACRVLTLNTHTLINQAFFEQRFNQALARRQRLFEIPFYRLIHAEGDNLPGLIIDRFNDTLVCQTSTTGMEKLKPLWINALQNLLSPQRIILRDDIPIRAKEGLPLQVNAFIGNLEENITVQENNLTFYANPLSGQKTGWFYDQRANRKWVALNTKNKTVLDLYTYNGGFGINAAKQGAKHTTFVDSSAAALEMATQAAKANNVIQNCTFVNENVFTLLPQFCAQHTTFEVVIADPPAFVKQIQHKQAGLRGYQKLAKLAAQVVAPQGMLFIASCSHHANPTEFRMAIEAGIHKAGRKATFLRKGGADKDHPIHPHLPENHYLKSLAFKLD